MNHRKLKRERSRQLHTAIPFHFSILPFLAHYRITSASLPNAIYARNYASLSTRLHSCTLIGTSRNLHAEYRSVSISMLCLPARAFSASAVKSICMLVAEPLLFFALLPEQPASLGVLLFGSSSRLAAALAGGPKAP